MATTTRTTPTSKSKKPTAHFDIEAADNEVDETEEVEPYTVKLKGGRVIELRNPYDVGWKEAAAVDESTPFLFIQTMVKEEDYEDFIATDFKSRTMQKMVTGYREHYGLPTRGN